MLLFCMTAIAGMVVGCWKDNKTSPPALIDEGEPTIFTLSFMQPVSRAVGSRGGSADNNATVAESYKWLESHRRQYLRYGVIKGNKED